MRLTGPYTADNFLADNALLQVAFLISYFEYAKTTLQWREALML